ncbi:hypothetical protein FRB97_002131 [Tulasnella sp. 331]|nr:hypothetical protein FRB97_002131 [Tulasnella sp. 331]
MKSMTLARHCFKLLKYPYKGNNEMPKWIDHSVIEDAIHSCQAAVNGATGSTPPASEGSSGEIDVDRLFTQARKAIEKLYEAMYPGPSAQTIKDCFIENMDDARGRDRLNRVRKEAAVKTEAAKAIVRETLKEALDKATVEVHLSIVDITTPGHRPFLVRRQGATVTGKFQNTLRVHGLIHKLNKDDIIKETHEPRFYLPRGKKQALTRDGLMFEALEGRISLQSAAEQAASQSTTLELFLVLAAKQDSIAVITCGHKREVPNVAPDVGEIIRKPQRNNLVTGSMLSQPGDVYIDPKARIKMAHENIQWEKLTKGHWVLPLPSKSRTIDFMFSLNESTPQGPWVNPLPLDTSRCQMISPPVSHFVPWNIPPPLPPSASTVSEQSSRAYPSATATPAGSLRSQATLTSYTTTQTTSSSPNAVAPEKVISQPISTSEPTTGTGIDPPQSTRPYSQKAPFGHLNDISHTTTPSRVGFATRDPPAAPTSRSPPPPTVPLLMPIGALQPSTRTDHSSTQVTRIVSVNPQGSPTPPPEVDGTERRLSKPSTPRSVAHPKFHIDQTQVKRSRTDSSTTHTTFESCNSDMDSLFSRPISIPPTNTTVDPRVSAPPVETCDLALTPTASLTASIYSCANTPVMNSYALPGTGTATPSVTVASLEIAPAVASGSSSTSSLGTSPTPTLHEAMFSKARGLDPFRPNKFVDPPTRPNPPGSTLSPTPPNLHPVTDQVSVSIGLNPRARSSFSSIASRGSAPIPPVPVTEQPSPPPEPPFPTPDTTVNPIHVTPRRDDHPTREDQAMQNGEPPEKPRKPLPVIYPTRKVADNSWGGWLKKKVVPKVVRYVFGVPEFD